MKNRRRLSVEGNEDVPKGMANALTQNMVTARIEERMVDAWVVFEKGRVVLIQVWFVLFEFHSLSCLYIAAGFHDLELQYRNLEDLGLLRHWTCEVLPLLHKAAMIGG